MAREKDFADCQERVVPSLPETSLFRDSRAWSTPERARPATVRAPGAALALVQERGVAPPTSTSYTRAKSVFDREAPRPAPPAVTFASTLLPKMENSRTFTALPSDRVRMVRVPSTVSSPEKASRPLTVTENEPDTCRALAARSRARSLPVVGTSTDTAVVPELRRTPTWVPVRCTAESTAMDTSVVACRA